MSNTVPVGVRVPVELLDKAKALDPQFNLSEFVRGALADRYGSVEDKIDYLLCSVESELK